MQNNYGERINWLTMKTKTYLRLKDPNTYFRFEKPISDLVHLFKEGIK